MSYHLKELWEEWELRALVLLSLTIQVLLIFLGHHWKYRSSSSSSAIFLWLCYLVADSAAIYALGKITTQLKQMHHDTAKGLDPNAQIAGFWAPFLLLHLGGPDTITAYALEDNELWLRHAITLAIQTAMTLYIFQVLTGSDLRKLSLLMIVSGFIKCAERVYVLWAASSNQFRDSIPDPALHYSKILEEYKLKMAEVYDITPHEVMDLWRVNVEHNSSVDGDLSSSDEKLLSDDLKKKLKQSTEKSNCS